MASAHITFAMDQAFSDIIGKGGISAQSFETAKALVQKAVERLRKDYHNKTLALLQLPQQTHDLADVKAMANTIRHNASDIVFLGTGGSSLGGQTLAQLADYMIPGLGRLHEPRVHFLDNLDPLSFETFLNKLPLTTTRFVAISKSGGTGETLMQAMAVLSKLDKEGLRSQTSTLMFGLSEPSKPGKINALRALLEPEGVSFLEHDTGVGGRYSGLTNVGLLPAAILGLTVEQFRQGAGEALNSFLSDPQSPSVLGAALNIAASSEGKNITVIKAYSDRLERFTKWWVQLWAESIGKDGKGTQPVAAIGPVDQHSQLQLYLAGPQDKLFTIMTTDVGGKGPAMDAALCERIHEPGFSGKTIGDLVAAQGRATADTLAKNAKPVRRIHVPELNEYSFGYLLMHFMLETILAGYALNVDPFDQPAVEEGKILAKQYLA